MGWRWVEPLPFLRVLASPVQRPALCPLSPPKGRRAPGQGFLLRAARGVACVAVGAACPFPAARGRSSGCCCLTDSTPFFPTLPSGSAPPSTHPPPWVIVEPPEELCHPSPVTVGSAEHLSVGGEASLPRHPSIMQQTGPGPGRPRKLVRFWMTCAYINVYK